MKKIAFVAAAVAALGVAACTPKTADTNNSADLNATENSAAVDVNGAVVDANSTTTTTTTNTTNTTGGNVGTAVSNGASAVGNTAARGASAVGNTVEAGATAVANTAHKATH
jgi:hypothetical protein